MERELVSRCRALGRTERIGTSVFGRGIYLVRPEEPSDTLVVCATHAREHITTEVLFRLFESEGLWCDFLPVHNIDGVMLAKYGVGSAVSSSREGLIKINGGEDFSLWKANGNAVDLNVNFAARWGEGRKNVRFPAPENYIGPYPESEPETRAVAEWLRKNEYAQVVSFHTKGEVVYWGFSPNFIHYAEAKRFADALRYDLVTAQGSCGGLKDYFDLLNGGLGLTVELGEDRYLHPYPYREVPRLVEKLKKAMEILYENGRTIQRKRSLYAGSAFLRR